MAGGRDEGFELGATLVPARSVGGDLFDHFREGTRVFFLVGDVSGKGVPASLLMAVTKTMVKAKATQGLSPEKVLTHVNQDLSLDNESMMFVTLFLGILDTRTGELEYCNAGHNPPLLLSPAGRVLILQPTGGIALGVAEEGVYQSRKVILQRGDSLLLYTDGVTEAMNKREELFSEGRLIKELAEMKGQSIRFTKPPRTAAGSCGRGWIGGGTTNWKSIVVSPMTTLPRQLSVSGIWVPLGVFWTLLEVRRAARSGRPVTSSAWASSSTKCSSGNRRSQPEPLWRRNGHGSIVPLTPAVARQTNTSRSPARIWSVSFSAVRRCRSSISVSAAAIRSSPDSRVAGEA